ncbi:MAG TPA: hypothetical protein VGM14_25035 [Streptosporangiaceae bacterium]|jgi:hypothetical protein
MDTWAIQTAAHVALTSGLNPAPIPVIGAESTNSYAFGAGLTVLAFAAARVSRQFDQPWRIGGDAPAGKTKLRKRAKLKPSRVLADRADEQKLTNEPVQERGADEIFWPPKRSADSPAGGYQSKHRLPGPARQSHRERPAPRHAAPSARFLAR